MSFAPKNSMKITNNMPGKKIDRDYGELTLFLSRPQDVIKFPGQKGYRSSFERNGFIHGGGSLVLHNTVHRIIIYYFQNT